MPPHPVDSPEPGTLTPIACACRRELRGVLLGLLLLCPPAQGWAQTDTPAAVRIDGGDLADVLNRYAREAGVSLSYDASLLRGLTWLAGRPAPGRRIEPEQPLDPGAGLWLERRLSVIDMPLPQWLAELGRYRAGHLGYAPELADLRVSGVYPLDDTDAALDLLAAGQGLRIERWTRYWVRVLPG
jgi:hypothetical protein